MRRLTIAAILVIAVCVPAPSASATTWSVSCHLPARLDMVKPLRLAVENNGFQTYASGTCAGTLDGKPYDGPASAYTDGRMNLPMSCLVAAGRGMASVLQFGGSPGDVDATLLDNYTMFTANVLNFGEFVWNGAYNGYGTGEARVLNGGQDQFNQCAGPGLNSVEIDLQERTITPMYG